MSAPVLVACAASAVALALPVLAGAAQLGAQQQAGRAADAAALAAADALSGWIEQQPCEIAAEVTRAAGAELAACTLDEASLDARIEVSVPGPFTSAFGRAHAGPGE